MNSDSNGVLSLLFRYPSHTISVQEMLEMAVEFAYGDFRNAVQEKRVEIETDFEIISKNSIFKGHSKKDIRMRRQTNPKESELGERLDLIVDIFQNDLLFIFQQH